MNDEPNNSLPPDAGSTPPLTSIPAKQAIADPLQAIADHDTAPGEPAASPAWASDLRQLYNAVVEEPLPDSFIALLSQLDAED